jgi:enoyl-CoA hydratase
MNKPIIGCAPGHSFNSGASWLSAIGLPTVTNTSKIAFNDVAFGFVPHGGSSFYLSRMPGELGTFLALTGIQINGIDAVETRIADHFVSKADLFAD